MAFNWNWFGATLLGPVHLYQKDDKGLALLGVTTTCTKSANKVFSPFASKWTVGCWRPKRVFVDGFEKTKWIKTSFRGKQLRHSNQTHLRFSSCFFCCLHHYIDSEWRSLSLAEMKHVCGTICLWLDVDLTNVVLYAMYVFLVCLSFLCTYMSLCSRCIIYICPKDYRDVIGCDWAWGELLCMYMRLKLVCQVFAWTYSTCSW